MELLLDGKLNEYLYEIDEECYEMLDWLVEQLKVKQGVTEQLKAENQMLWVGRMNNIMACAEEVVCGLPEVFKPNHLCEEKKSLK